ncbi:hypothetical protein HG556_08340, partial [Pasteurella multocida]|nr:hypothetical protein [Pasteurella multocida]
ITYHVEQTDCLSETLIYLRVHYLDLLLGLTLCPDTELDLLTPSLAQLDFIQILTLYPLTGVKADTDAVIERITLLSNMLGEHRVQKLISVDGSLNLAMASPLFPFGIYWVVSGSSLSSPADIDSMLSDLKSYLCCYFVFCVFFCTYFYVLIMFFITLLPHNQAFTHYYKHRDY